jgi:hypothetical protein
MGTWSKRPDSGFSTTPETTPNNNNNNNNNTAKICAIPALDDTVSTLVEMDLDIVGNKACRHATSRSRILLEKLVMSQSSRNSTGPVKFTILLLSSQKHFNGPCPEPDDTSALPRRLSRIYLRYT